MGYIETVLGRDEKVIRRGKVRWIIYYPVFVTALIGLSIFLYAEIVGPKTAGVWGLVFVLVALIAWLQTWIVRATTEIAVTDHRVIVKRGLIRRSTMEMNCWADRERSSRSNGDWPAAGLWHRSRKGDGFWHRTYHQDCRASSYARCDQQSNASLPTNACERRQAPSRVTHLILRRIKDHFVIAGPDIEPMKFKSRREAKDWCRWHHPPSLIIEIGRDASTQMVEGSWGGQGRKEG